MEQIHKSGGNPGQRERQVQMAEHGERLSESNGPDSFPEEGTDDKMVQARDTGDVPFSDTEALRATQGVIARGLSGEGKTRADWPQGQSARELDDGNNKG